MTNIWEERKRGLEEEYFRRQEQEALEKIRRRLAAEEWEHQTEVSSCCPKCGGELEEISLVRGVTVDRCTGCRGGWLDAWEVERLSAWANQGWLRRFWRGVGR
jgi:hypothetical protein